MKNINSNITNIVPIEQYQSEIPKGYTITKSGQLQRISTDDNKIFVCDYVPHIETIYLNERENQTLWTIKWEESSGWKRLELIPKGKFSTTSKITELYEKGFSVTSDNANELVKYFQRYEAMYKDEIEKQLAYDQLGYIKGGFLLPNQFISSDKRQDIVFQASGGNIDYVKGFTESGSLQEWMANVFEPIKTRKIPLTFILASIGSPLLNYFNVPTFILDLSNPTSQGKTITMKCGCSVWGSWDIHNTWYGTVAGIERRAVMLNHLPYFIDDTKNNKFKKEDLSTLIYTLASGKEKTRSGLKENHISRKWNNIILSTGERKITEFSNASGTVARVLAIYGKPIEDNLELINQLEASTIDYYGTAGVTFLKWFVQQDSQKMSEYKMTLQAYERQYADRTTNPIIKRTAKYMAFIRLIADMVQEAFSVEIDTRLLDSVWIEVVEDNQGDTADRPLQALREAVELAERNKTQFYEKSEDSVFPIRDSYGENHKDKKILCYYPSFIKDFLEQRGYDSNTILKQWKERGYIKTKENENKNTFQIRSVYENKTKRFVVIDLTHKDLQEEAE